MSFNETFLLFLVITYFVIEYIVTIKSVMKEL